MSPFGAQRTGAIQACAHVLMLWSRLRGGGMGGGGDGTKKLGAMDLGF